MNEAPSAHNGDDFYESKLERVWSEIRRLDQLRDSDSENRLRLIDEQIKRLDQRMSDADKAVAAALTAAKEAVSAALVAAEKAVDKAEVAQQKVNEAQIENRGTLKDQARELMPRLETENSFRELRAKIAGQDSALGELRSRIDVGPPSLSTLQTRSDENEGRRGGALDTRALTFSVVAAFVGVIGIVLAIAAFVAK